MKAFIFLLLFSSQAMAATATLSWDASTGATGYKVYYGTAPGAYTGFVDAGAALTMQVQGLLPEKRYYFATKAYNAIYESGYSNEITAVTMQDVIIPPPPPVSTITLLGIAPLAVKEVQLQPVADATVTKYVWKLHGALIGGLIRAKPVVVQAYYKTPGLYTVTLTRYVGDVVKDTSTVQVEVAP